MSVVRRVVVALLPALFLTIPASAQTPEEIPDFAAIREEMELTKGALNQAVGMTVLNSYIPDFGAVFIFAIRIDKTIEQARAEIERALRFLAPSLERLKDDDRIVMIGQHEGVLEEWEVMYITTVYHDEAGSNRPDLLESIH